MNLCPRFTIWSFLALLSLVEAIVFGVEIYLGGISNESFLAASPNILDKMGEKVGRGSLLHLLGPLRHAVSLRNLAFLHPNLSTWKLRSPLQ